VYCTPTPCKAIIAPEIEYTQHLPSSLRFGGMFGRASKLAPAPGGALTNGLKKRAYNKEHWGTRTFFYRELGTKKIAIIAPEIEYTQHLPSSLRFGGMFGRASKLAPAPGGALPNGLKKELTTKSIEELEHFL
jgi:hypothetical protein